MDSEASVRNNDSTRVEWMWQSNPNPWLDSESIKWSHYEDIENLIIEEKFMAKCTHAVLDDYSIDFERYLQISNDDPKKQRRVQRCAGRTLDKRLRQNRFDFDPIAPKFSFGGQYGWVSPFILEARKDLKLDEKQLPSQDETIVPMIVEKAALGIIEEGKKIGKKCAAKRIAEELMQKKDKGVKEVWKCCARLYTMDSFLYRKINEIMRLIGYIETEHIWRSKISSIGPFCLLLWDNPFELKPKTLKKPLYRAVNLTDDQIDTYKQCLQQPNEYHSFQTFISATRSRYVGEFFGTNTLFIMEVKCAFTADVQPYSLMFAEEEELINPGVCFTVQQIEFDENAKKHFIHLELQQRYNKSAAHEISNNQEPVSTGSFSSIHTRFSDQLRDADFKGIAGFLFNYRNNNRRLRQRNRDGFNLTNPLTILLPLSYNKDDNDDDDDE